MDSEPTFLDTDKRSLLWDIMNRRAPHFSAELRAAGSFTAEQVQRVMVTLSDELTDNLDEGWEPTEYGRRVGTLMAEVNREQVGR